MAGLPDSSWTTCRGLSKGSGQSGSFISPSSCAGIPSNKAIYRFFTVRFLNCAWRCWCTSLLLAINNKPDVAISNRCTIIGPVASGYSSFTILYTEPALPFPGTESIPAGLSITNNQSSSKRTSSSVSWHGLFDNGSGSTSSPFNICCSIGSHFPLQAG